MDIKGARIAAEDAAREWSPFVITSETQTSDSWVFSLGDPSGAVVAMNIPMLVVDKKGDGLREVYLPSDEGFAILKKERPIEDAA